MSLIGLKRHCLSASRAAFSKAGSLFLVTTILEIVPSGLTQNRIMISPDVEAPRGNFGGFLDRTILLPPPPHSISPKPSPSPSPLPRLPSPEASRSPSVAPTSRVLVPVKDLSVDVFSASNCALGWMLLLRV